MYRRTIADGRVIESLSGGRVTWKHSLLSNYVWNCLATFFDMADVCALRATHSDIERRIYNTRWHWVRSNVRTTIPQLAASKDTYTRWRVPREYCSTTIQFWVHCVPHSRDLVLSRFPNNDELNLLHTVPALQNAYNLSRDVRGSLCVDRSILDPRDACSFLNIDVLEIIVWDHISQISDMILRWLSEVDMGSITIRALSRYGATLNASIVQSLMDRQRCDLTRVTLCNIKPYILSENVYQGFIKLQNVDSIAKLTYSDWYLEGPKLQ